jgi:hypothetical protein
MKKEIADQRERTSNLETKIDDLEQDNYKNEIVISGNFEIPSLPSPSNISSLLLKTCNTSITPNTINSFFFKKNSKGQSMLKLNLNRPEKIALLKAKKDLSKKQIYVNEVLTNLRFKLLMEAKNYCKQQKLHSTWTRNGNIFIKKAADSNQFIMLKSMDHLRSLC